MAKTIRIVSERSRHLSERGEVISKQCIANDHSGVAVGAAYRKIFSHTLNHSQRQVSDTADRKRIGPYQLKRMHKLMTQHMIGLRIGFEHRHHNAAFQCFGNTLCSYPNITAHSRCLLKVGIGCENYNWVAKSYGIQKNLLMSFISFFAQVANPVCHRIISEFMANLVIEGLINLQIEISVVGFISSKTLC